MGGGRGGSAMPRCPQPSFVRCPALPRHRTSAPACGRQVALLQESRAPKWNRETARLNYSPVSMRELERVGLNAVSLGIMENEADLDTIKNYTAGVFVVFSIAAIAFGELGAQLFPGKNVGPTITYVLGV